MRWQGVWGVWGRGSEKQRWGQEREHTEPITPQQMKSKEPAKKEGASRKQGEEGDLYVSQRRRKKETSDSGS